MTVAQKEEAARIEIRIGHAREGEAIRAELIHGAQAFLAQLLFRGPNEENPGSLRLRRELTQHELRALSELLKVTSTMQRLDAGEATTRTESRDAPDLNRTTRSVIVAMTREQQDAIYERYEEFVIRVRQNQVEDS